MDNQNDADHLDPTAEISLQTVKERAVRGVVVLTGRTFFLSVISLVATALLTVFLSPSEFGVFWIVSAVVNFLAYFSDVGLAAALIQKKEKIEEVELRTTFTIQQILVVVLLLILFVSSPFLEKYYSLSFEGKLLMYSLGFSLLLSSLKTIPSILMERELDFSKLVLPQIFENIVYNVIAVFFAWKGFGIMSFTYAVIIRGFTGLVVIYILRPWRPGLAIAKTPLRKLLSFGIPYQLNTFLATLKDDGMTAFLGGILGTSGIGFLGWAQKWAYTPLRLFMDPVLKVTFPAFSRIQDNGKDLERAVGRSIFFVCLLVFPTTFGLLILAPILVEIIPRYEKWQPALIPLYFISINTFFAAVTTQLTNLFNAIGKIKVTFKLMVMWTVLTWLFVPTLGYKYGVNGAAFGYSLVGASSIVAILISRKYVKFSLKSNVFMPLIASGVMALTVYTTTQFLSHNFISVIFLIFEGVVVYIFGIYLLIGKGIITDAKRSVEVFFSKGK